MTTTVPRSQRWADDRGSAPAEFVMVGSLLVVLLLAVMQLALALHVRNTVIDAAAEGARYAALADSSIDAGAERTRRLITMAIGEGYAGDISGRQLEWRGQPAAEISVSTPLPLLGLIGIDGALEVDGHAPIEQLAD